MKLARLSLLLFALVMSVLTVPQAFGARKGGGRLVMSGGRLGKGGHSKTQNKSAGGCDGYIYSISCSNGSGACCTGSLYDCWDFCDSYCGDSCVYIP